MLQEHMAGLAAKDTMVQQIRSELHESKQGLRRYAFNISNTLSTMFMFTSTKIKMSWWIAAIAALLSHPLLSIEIEF